MNIITIAIGAGAISLLLVVIWMFSLSAKKKREQAEKIAREAAYRKAMLAARERESQERIYKAETGHVPTQLFLAKEAESHNLREALHWYERASLADNEIAMYSMVRLCEKHSEHPVLKLKSKYWQKVIEARGGDKHAQFEAGLCLLKGLGVEQNIDAAITMIEEVANDDIIDAQLYMGDWCVAESNPNPNPLASAEWHYRAAKLESIEGMVRLSNNYEKGIGVEQSFVRASYWLEVAAETGSGRAQYRAGELWAKVDTDHGYALSYIWFYLSAQFGYEPAKKRRDDISSKIEIDSIVGLQGVSKPILVRMKENKIKKHSVIKALNKMYKREAYFPDVDGDEFMTPPSSSEVSEVQKGSDQPTKAASSDYSQGMQQTSS